MLSVLLASALVLQSVSSRGQPAPSPAPQNPVAQQPVAQHPVVQNNDWVVVLSAAIYQPDGGVLTETAPLPAAGAGLVHVFARKSVCDPAIAGAVEPPDAGFGWRINSQIVSRNDREVVVSLDWKRMWDAGRKITNGPGSTVQLTLHPGDRIPLDHITNATPRPDCRAVGLSLDVRLARAATPSRTPAASIPLGATPGGARPVNAELWLTHTLPSGTVQVLHQTVRVPAEGGRFGFAPTTVEAARGNLAVQIAGSIDRYRSPSGTEFLIVSMNRLVTGEGLPEAGVSGTTSSVQQMPASPSDVLSFEMPGTVARGGGGGRGGGVARGAGSGAAVTAGGRGSADPQGGVVGTGGARGGRGAAIATLTPLLEGHKFALTVRITQVN